MALMHCTDLNANHQTALRETAVHAIESALAKQDFHPDLDDADSVLRESGASFVTLTKKGDLRGCIGTLEAFQPLLADVASNARNAAFKDPRFMPVVAEEWDKCEMSVSVLSSPQPLLVSSEQELKERLKPGRDGLIISCNQHKATFLPSVWEQLSDPTTFVRELKFKAGLGMDFWSSNMNIYTYQTICF